MIEKFNWGYAYGYRSKDKFGFNCRVCGYMFDELTWGEDEKCPTYDFCPCCSCEIGLQDEDPVSARLFRLEWSVGQNMEWHTPSKKPKNWSWEEQKKQIPPAFRNMEDGGWE